MDRKTLLTLAGALVVLIVLVFAVDSLMGGLPGTVREIYAQEEAGIGSAKGVLEKYRQNLAAFIAKDENFLKPIGEREGWNAQLDEAQELLEKAEETWSRDARPLFEKNNSDDTQKLVLSITTVRTDRQNALKTAEALCKRAEKLLDYKARRNEIVEESKKRYEAMKGTDLGAIKVKAEKASSDWPEKKTDIAQRMEVFDSIMKTAEESIKSIEEESTKPEDETDYDTLVHRVETLKHAQESFDDSYRTIPLLLDQLYLSWDKILEDMEITEGYEVLFFHTYKIIKIDEANQTSEEVKKEQVTRDVYMRHEEHLGMVLESKPKGKFDFDASKLASPPGYNYIGNSHYGRWERDRSGRSFWVFYGQYALMRNLFWGSGFYRPVYRSDWDGYRQAQSRGQTYYGSDTAGQKVYGSKGTQTAKKYAGSKYQKSSGYKYSKFKQSGGTWRGTKYAARSTGSHGRSFSSGSRSSRSFGGK